MVVDRLRLGHELRALRQRQGVTAARIVKSPQLASLLRGEKAELSGGASLLDVFTLLLNTDIISDERDREALSNALGVGFSRARTLTDRRREFASKHERHPDTIESWENAAIEELVQKMSDQAFSLWLESPIDQIDHFSVVRGYQTRYIFITGIPEAGVDSPVLRGQNNTNLPSLPMSVFEARSGLSTSRLILRVAFEGPTPAIIWAAPAASIYELIFASKRKWLTVDDKNMVHIVFNNPKPKTLYAICWQWHVEKLDFSDQRALKEG